MKCKCESELTENSPFAIKDTKELTAKKLLTYFLETFDPLTALLHDSETVKTLYKITEKSKDLGLTFHEQTIAESLPWEVCYSFSKFLLECPHVHVTID